MAKIPQIILEKQRVLTGLFRLGQGKVRDTYEIHSHPDKLFPVASNRISIFDFVLNAEVKQKGEVLTAMSIFWMKNVLDGFCETDLLAFGAGIDGFLPVEFRGDIELQKTSTVIRKLRPPAYEDIVRFHLTGSGLKAYQRDRMVCGQLLPSGLTDGSCLPFPIYTPTTKAEIGHDEHVTADSVAVEFGVKRERLALQVAGAMASYAQSRCGIILADTKVEFCVDPQTGRLVLGDEKGTPDSSRFWDTLAWQKAMAKGKLPPSFDKQYVREWGKKLGIHDRNPELLDDVEYVHSLNVPQEVLDNTTRLYRYIFWRLSGVRLEVFQRDQMGIAVPVKKPKIEIVVGSESDVSQLMSGMSILNSRAEGQMHIVSCHRNRAELDYLASSRLANADVVIACAGKAAVLPGVIKAALCEYDCGHIPVIGVAMPGKTTTDDQAAILSIENLPDQPVELDPYDHAYFGKEGFESACRSALNHEFLPKAYGKKPAQLGFLPIG